MSDHDTIEKIVAEIRKDSLFYGGEQALRLDNWADRLDSLRQVPEVVTVSGYSENLSAVFLDRDKFPPLSTVCVYAAEANSDG